MDRFSKIEQWNHGFKTMIQKCIQHIKKKKKLLLLKNLWEPWRIKPTIKSLQF